MRRQRWTLWASLAVLMLLVMGWLVSIVRPTVLRAYGLGARGADGMYNLGMEVGLYRAGIAFTVDRFGHTSARWIAAQPYAEARHGYESSWRWWPRVERSGGPMGSWTEVFVPFWLLAGATGGMVVWLHRR